MLPFNTLIRDDIHFKVVERINEETVISNFVSSKRSKRTLSWSKEFNEIDQNSLFDVKNILKYIAKSLLHVYYLNRYGERVVKSWESDFILKFEIKIKETLKNFHLIRSFVKELKNIVNL